MAFTMKFSDIYVDTNSNITYQYPGNETIAPYPNYNYFNEVSEARIDFNYYIDINPTENVNVMKCMIFRPTSLVSNMSITIDSIDMICDAGGYVLGLGDIIIRVYEITGTTPSIIEPEILSPNLVTRYVAQTAINPIGSIYKISCVKDPEYLNWTFNPNDTIRNSCFVIGVQLTINLPPTTIFIYKSIYNDCKYESDDSNVIANVMQFGDITNNDNYVMNNNTNDIISLKESNGGDIMGLFALDFFGLFTLSTPNCFHGFSLVHTNNGVIYAKDINKNDKLLDHNNNCYDITNIIKTKGCKDFIHIKKDSISKEVPYTDFYITRTHMIKVGDEELQAQELLDKYEGVRLVKLNKSSDVYSFSTENGNYVNINGLNVLTFNSNELI